MRTTPRHSTRSTCSRGRTLRADARVRAPAGAGAIELDVRQRAFGFLAALFESRGELRLCPAQRELLQHRFGSLERLLGAQELTLHATATGKRPLRGHDGLALGVVQRVLAEP